jgi:hypothetical protein
LESNPYSERARLNHGLADARSQASKLTCHVLIPPVEVLDTHQLGGAPSAEAGDHHRRPGADIGDGDDVAAEGARAIHLDPAPVREDVDLRAQRLEFTHVLEAVVKEKLLDHGAAAGLGHEGGVLGLEIGGEAGVRPGDQVHRSELAFPANLNGCALLLDLGTRLAQLVYQRVELVQGAAAGQLSPAASRRYCDQVGARLEVVGDDGVGIAVEHGDAVDLDPVCAGAPDLCPHAHQRHRQVGHVRLTGGVRDRGVAVGQDRRHHDVLGAGDRRHIQLDFGAAQPVRGADEAAVLLVDDRAQPLQSVDVLVHAPHTDVVAAGLGHHGSARSCQQGAEEEQRSPHLLCRRHRYVRRDRPGRLEDEAPVG